MSSEQTEWNQVHYGKLVQSEGGPIKKAFEHCHTGRSSRMHSSEESREALDKCNPHIIGIGDNDFGHWGSQYPWPRDSKGGGLTIQPAFSQGGWYVVAGRQRQRLETGENATAGRFYTEAHYLTHKHAGLEKLPLHNLADHLDATPLLAGNKDLSQVTIARTGNEALPEGWFQEIRPILEKLLSGQAHGETDRKRTPEEFYQLARRTIACLPAALRWRIPIVAGGWYIEPHIGLGHGLARKESFEGAATPSEKISRQVQKVLGEIEACAADRKTLADVCEAIDGHFKNYSRTDAIPLAPLNTQGDEKQQIGRWWRNSVGRFRSEICGEQWVDPPEPKKPEPKKEEHYMEPRRKPGFFKRWFGAGMIGAATIAGSGEIAEAHKYNELDNPDSKNIPSWVDRSNSNANPSQDRSQLG